VDGEHHLQHTRQHGFGHVCWNMCFFSAGACEASHWPCVLLQTQMYRKHINYSLCSVPSPSHSWHSCTPCNHYIQHMCHLGLVQNCRAGDAPTDSLLLGQGTSTWCSWKPHDQHPPSTHTPDTRTPNTHVPAPTLGL
jgi:hypothetical protein